MKGQEKGYLLIQLTLNRGSVHMKVSMEGLKKCHRLIQVIA
jgi:hypothetical protein